jgi:hypothetical protein
MRTIGGTTNIFELFISLRLSTRTLPHRANRTLLRARAPASAAAGMSRIYVVDTAAAVEACPL